MQSGPISSAQPSQKTLLSAVSLINDNNILPTFFVHSVGTVAVKEWSVHACQTLCPAYHLTNTWGDVWDYGLPPRVEGSKYMCIYYHKPIPSKALPLPLPLSEWSCIYMSTYIEGTVVLIQIELGFTMLLVSFVSVVSVIVNICSIAKEHHNVGELCRSLVHAHAEYIAPPHVWYTLIISYHKMKWSNPKLRYVLLLEYQNAMMAMPTSTQYPQNMSHRNDIIYVYDRATILHIHPTVSIGAHMFASVKNTSMIMYPAANTQQKHGTIHHYSARGKFLFVCKK